MAEASPITLPGTRARIERVIERLIEALDALEDEREQDILDEPHDGDELEQDILDEPHDDHELEPDLVFDGPWGSPSLGFDGSGNAIGEAIVTNIWRRYRGVA